MRRLTLARLEVPFREPVRIEGFEFGEREGAPTCAIVGQMRGDEAQQAYSCACIVERLSRMEGRSQIRKGVRVLVIPCANPFLLNIGSRLWPTDGADVNRRFPGDAEGDISGRIAAAIFAAVRGSRFGIQLASFNQRGDFCPHVRITRAGEISDESLTLARAFGLPFVTAHEPTPFDEGTLNVCWQRQGTHAFSLYGRTTERIDRTGAQHLTSAIMRFLGHVGLVGRRSDASDRSVSIDESGLMDVRANESAGYLESRVGPGDQVRQGQELGVVRDAFDTHVRERLVSPRAGRVFFCRTQPLVWQRLVVYRIAPDWD